MFILRWSWWHLEVVLEAVKAKRAATKDTGIGQLLTATRAPGGMRARKLLGWGAAPCLELKLDQQLEQEHDRSGCCSSRRCQDVPRM